MQTEIRSGCDPESGRALMISAAAAAEISRCVSATKRWWFVLYSWKLLKLKQNIIRIYIYRTKDKLTLTQAQAAFQIIPIWCSLKDVVTAEENASLCLEPDDSRWEPQQSLRWLKMLPDWTLCSWSHAGHRAIIKLDVIKRPRHSAEATGANVMWCSPHASTNIGSLKQRKIWDD